MRIGAGVAGCLVITVAVCLGAAEVWDEAYRDREGALIGAVPLALFAIGVVVALVAAVVIGLDRPLVGAGTAILCGATAFLILSTDRAGLMNASIGGLVIAVVIVGVPLVWVLLARGVLRMILPSAPGGPPPG